MLAVNSTIYNEKNKEKCILGRINQVNLVYIEALVYFVVNSLFSRWMRSIGHPDILSSSSIRESYKQTNYYIYKHILCLYIFNTQHCLTSPAQQYWVQNIREKRQNRVISADCSKNPKLLDNRNTKLRIKTVRQNMHA